MNDDMDAETVAGDWPRDLLVVRGPDAVDFLQGQLSADVVTLDPGQSTLSLLLRPAGKMEALLRLWRTDEHIVVIDTDHGTGDAVARRLTHFLVRTDATIQRLAWKCRVIRGPASMAVETDGTGAELVGLGMWPGIDGVDLFGPSPSIPAGVAAASPELLEAMRIRAGWPVAGAEITDAVIPAEIGSWLMTAAVSFTKGCYVGQELTARIESRGRNVPRHLRSFELPAGVEASPGDDIVIAGEVDAGAVGSVTSAAVDPRTGTTVALGYVKRSVSEDATVTVAPSRR